MMQQTGVSYQAFGVALAFDDLCPPGAWAPATAAPSVRVMRSSREAVLESFSGVRAQGWTAPIDGGTFRVDVGHNGDHLFSHPTGVHHLSPAGTCLMCAPVDLEAPAWWRVLLDSVLFSVALHAGREALHAGSVVIADRALAITAPPGGGKTTLVNELLSRGHTLIADDITVIDEDLLAYPGPPVMNLPATAPHPAADVITRLADEIWVSAPVADRPAPLGAVVFLDRGPDRPTALEPLANPMAPLLGALLAFPTGAERELRRFDLASRISEGCALLRLSAAIDVAPGELANALEIMAMGI